MDEEQVVEEEIVEDHVLGQVCEEIGEEKVCEKYWCGAGW